jgi:hypothetical protein
MSQEKLSVLEAVSTAKIPSLQFVIYTDKGEHVGWHTDFDNPNAKCAYKTCGWTDNKHSLDWLMNHFHQAIISSITFIDTGW